MKIKVIMTMREISDKLYTREAWDKFCDMFGWSPYCLNEGLDDETEQTMTLEQAKELELIKDCR